MYQLISEEDARIAANELYKTIYQWTGKHLLSNHLTQDSRNFIRQKICKAASDLFGYFYLTIKIHKTPRYGTCLGGPLCDTSKMYVQQVQLASHESKTTQKAQIT